MNEADDTDGLRSVALQNAASVLRTRRRAEEQLLEAQNALQASAARLRLALSAGHLGDWTWDCATDIVRLTPRVAEIFALDADSITWTRMRERLHEDDRERARLAVETALADHAEYTIEYRVVVPSGEVRWVAANGLGNYGPDGAVLGMTGIVQDITARKRAEDALRDETRVLELLNRTGAMLSSELELETLVQSVTDAATELSGARFGAFFYNVTGEGGDAFMLYTLSGASRKQFEHFGMPRATALFGPTFHGAPSIRSDDILADPRYGKSAPHFGMPSGHLPVRSYLAVPVISRSGEAIGGLFFGHPDPAVFTARAERIVTGVAAQAAVAIDNARLYERAQKAAEERQKLLESERVVRAALERMSEIKDNFLATLSHELRTPLSSILGWSQILKRGGVSSQDLAKGLDTIERNARAQTQLIEELLDMNRITSGKVHLELRSVSLLACIEPAVETLRPTAEAKGVRVDTALDASAPVVNGDPQRLQQVVWNLLSNAIKFTPQGGRVSVVLRGAGTSGARIEVEDNGIGIGPDFQPHVFERFTQENSSSTRKYGGLGLGLSIVKSLVELHGGTVFVHSDGENRGSRFTVDLPAGPMTAAGPAPTPRQPAGLPEAPAAFHPLDLSGLKILVVDDETDARDWISHVLQACSAEVATAGSADEALQLAAAFRPHVLVSDIGMPQQDGIELLRRLRALEADLGEGFPAIALTAFAGPEDRARVLRAGFSLHLSKPIEPAALAAAVASVVPRADQAMAAPAVASGPDNAK